MAVTTNEGNPLQALVYRPGAPAELAFDDVVEPKPTALLSRQVRGKSVLDL